MPSSHHKIGTHAGIFAMCPPMEFYVLFLHQRKFKTVFHYIDGMDLSLRTGSSWSNSNNHHCLGCWLLAFWTNLKTKCRNRIPNSSTKCLLGSCAATQDQLALWIPKLFSFSFNAVSAWPPSKGMAGRLHQIRWYPQPVNQDGEQEGNKIFQQTHPICFPCPLDFHVLDVIAKWSKYGLW